MTNNKYGWFNIVMERLPITWLENKRYLDDLNGLWRIHDSLYDVTNFIDSHPGGRFWLEETKGMDVTELFESHHINSNLPEEVLKNFYIRKINKPRLSPYTFKEDGFYRTMKRKARDIFKTLPKELSKTSDMYSDMLFIGTLTFACLANAFSMYIFAVIAGLFGGLVVISAHNYMHQRDNFRMYYEDILMLSTRTFRIMHILSHHAFPNTTSDFQLLFIQPVTNVFPQKKSFWHKYASWFTMTTVVFPLILHIVYFLSILECFIRKQLCINVLLPLIVPVVMHSFGNEPWLSTFYMWNIIIIVTSYTMSLIAYTTTHIHPELYIEGDVTRSGDELDWGINQLDTSCDKKETGNSHFFSLTTYGDHAMHHLFPTLDHGYLKHLYPLLNQTLNEFRLKKYHIKPQIELYLGFFQRAVNEVPNQTSPCL